jgi:hypothetical protein
MLHLSILLKHRILYASKKFTIGVYCLLFYLIAWEEKKLVHTNFTEFTNYSFVARSPMHEESESIYGVSEMSFLLLIPLQRTGKCASNKLIKEVRFLPSIFVRFRSIHTF